MKDTRKLLALIDNLQDDLNTFGLDLTSEKEIKRFDRLLNSFLYDMCRLIDESNDKPFICPVCGNDKTCLTIAHHCNRCSESWID